MIYQIRFKNIKSRLDIFMLDKSLGQQGTISLEKL